VNRRTIEHLGGITTLMHVVVALVLLIAATATSAAEPRVSVEIRAQQPVLVGQQVEIGVKISAPNYFLSAPVFPDLQIAGAVVTMPDETGLNSSEVVEGTTYAAIEKSYVFVAQQPGEFTLPALRIEFRYADDAAKPVAGAVELPPETINVQLPAGATSLADAAPAARISVDQTLDRSIDGMKAGDALTRTVAIFAAHTQAMMIPPTHFDAPAHVRVYPADPVLADETRDHVGFVGGHRTDRATYVFEKPGDYTLPAIEVGWVDPASQERQTSTASAIVVHVAADGDAQPAIAPEAPEDAPAAMRPFAWRAWVGVAVLGLAVLVTMLLIARRVAPKVREVLAERRTKYLDSEAHAFSRVERACRDNNAMGAYEALLRWCLRSGCPSLANWRRTHSDPALAARIEQLEAALYSTRATPSWNGRELLAALREARTGTRYRHAREAALPPLNP
jgi:hypothetical protein